MAGSSHKVAIEKAVGWSCRSRLGGETQGLCSTGFYR